MLQCLCTAGAKLAGVPSGQAPNTFSDQNPYELPRTKLTLYMTCKYSVSFPRLAPEERFVKPDYELTYDRFKSYGFDPNAAVLLALDVLAGRVRPDGSPCPSREQAPGSEPGARRVPRLRPFRPCP
jgi:hypothetical protein